MHNGHVLLRLRTKSPYPKGQKCLRRRQKLPRVLDLGPSPQRLKASEAQSLAFGREEEFFVCKGMRINIRIKNYAQHPLGWKEPSLGLAPLPLDVPKAGQLLTPRGWICPGPIWETSILPNSTEQMVRTSACFTIARTAGNSVLGPSFAYTIGSYKFTFKTFE